jgi:hypothetical protein
MATITVTKGHNAPDGFVTGDTVTPLTLNAAQTPGVAISNIVDADLSASAGITAGKLASTLDLTGKTVTLPVSSVTTASIAAAQVTAAKLDGAQTGSAPIYGARAWVNINGASANNLNFDYTTSTLGTLVVVTTASAHGLRVGHVVYLEFTTGGAQRPTSRAYTLTAVGPENTKFNAVGDAKTSDTSGQGVLRRRTVRASGNVACVSPVNDSETSAEFAVNFAVALPDADYAVAGLSARSAVAQDNIVTARSTDVKTADACVIRAATGGGSQLTSCPLITAMFIR